MKCSRCGKELLEKDTYAHEGKPMCEDCLMEVGLHTRQCEPWSTYLAAKERVGKRGTEGLTVMQQQVYNFIKQKEKTTRDELKANFKFTEAEMDAQLTPLMHSELVKERGVANSLYLTVVR
ncbi:MAG: hypothetical protein PHR56_08755 [Dehalococcoidales bacterium]|nr:hypothetical protein [Dehalococcoidales bacterium]